MKNHLAYLFLALAMGCAQTGGQLPVTRASKAIIGARKVEIVVHPLKYALAGAIAVDSNGYPWFVGKRERPPLTPILGRLQGGRVITATPAPTSSSTEGIFANTLTADGGRVLDFEEAESGSPPVFAGLYGVTNKAGRLSPYRFSDCCEPSFSSMAAQSDPSTNLTWSAITTSTTGFVMAEAFPDKAGPKTTVYVPSDHGEPTAATLIAVSQSDQVYAYGSRTHAGPATAYFYDISKSKGKILSVFEAPTDVSALAAGVNVLWFTDPAANSVDVLIPSDNAVKRHSIPSKKANPQGLVVDCNGSVWFTEYNTGKIGTITSSGSIHEYLVGSGARPSEMARSNTCSSHNVLWVSLQQGLAEVDY